MFTLILVVVALVLVILVAINVPAVSRVNLVAAGLAFYVGANLVGRFLP